ncbi:MAG: ATP-binding protein [Acidimicrobiales bacterium]
MRLRAGRLSWRNHEALGTDRPWNDGVFWLVQVIVVVIFFARLGIEEKVSGSSVPGGVDFTTIGLFVWPVLYAAATFGPTGGTVTTALISVLSVSRLVEFANHSNSVAIWGECTQLIVLCVIAFVVGKRVAAERLARIQADEARRGHVAAEARYTGLFKTNAAPILIVDTSGGLVESNPAANVLFGERATSSVSLGDLVGSTTARELLSRHAATTEDRNGLAVTGVVVRVEESGTPMLYRADATRMDDSNGLELVQLVLHDVTMETMRQEWMEAYAARVLNAQEEERRHLAQELHDGPLQSLVYVCRRIDEISRQTGLTTELEDLRTLAEALVSDLRGIARGLRPSVLDDLGLVAATRRLLDDFEKRTGIDTTLGITGTERRLPTSIELALFRVAQEAISNAELHAEPQRVAVGMSFESGGVRLLVSDDGGGFRPGTEAARARGSLGLLGMRERLHVVGGDVEVHSSPGGGTTVDAWASTRSTADLRV